MQVEQVERVQRDRPYPDKHPIVGDGGLINVLQAQNVGRAVPVVADRSHGRDGHRLLLTRGPPGPTGTNRACRLAYTVSLWCKSEPYTVSLSRSTRGADSECSATAKCR